MIGDPKPTVTWKRANGEMNDPQKFQNKYDPTNNEHTLEVGILIIYIYYTGPYFGSIDLYTDW